MSDEPKKLEDENDEFVTEEVAAHDEDKNKEDAPKNDGEVVTVRTDASSQPKDNTPPTAAPHAPSHQPWQRHNYHHDTAHQFTKPAEVAEQPKQEQQPQPQAAVAPAPNANTPGVLVLQWLAYAFWGWFAVSLVWLVAYVFAYFVGGMNDASDASQVAYPLASVIVLFVIALVVDIFYAHKEPLQKTGGATAIMLIHGVIFALCAIGALITAVFAGINLTINAGVSSTGDGSKVALYTAGVMVLIYALLTARTIFGQKVKFLVQGAWVVFALTAITFAVIGVVGPAMQAAATKQDRLIEAGLPSLARDINSYASTNKELPESLSDITANSAFYREQQDQLVKSNLVRYTPNTKEKQEPTTNKSSTNTGISASYYTPVFFYKLCVTYQHEKNNTYSPAVYELDASTTPYTSSHPKGEVCYDLQTKYTY